MKITVYLLTLISVFAGALATCALATGFISPWWAATLLIAAKIGLVCSIALSLKAFPHGSHDLYDNENRVSHIIVGIFFIYAAYAFLWLSLRIIGPSIALEKTLQWWQITSCAITTVIALACGCAASVFVRFMFELPRAVSCRR